MSDFDILVKEQLARPEVAREYYRLAPFYRLADQLILLRKKRGLTQQELAEKAHTTQAVVSRLENASVRCSLETAVRLAGALDAVVEVTLTPVEELTDSTAATLDEASKDECAEVAKKENPTGIVYFSPKQKAPCSPLVYYFVDPLTNQLKSPSQVRKNKTLEIA